jgi:6-pyruvoyltetrahydropterin/6-carboxytetrahydropterin synthase
MAHRLIADAHSKCAIPHGHNEQVIARLQPVAPQRLDGGANMVVPFDRAKARWHRFVDDQVDHAFQLGARDPMIDWFRAHEPQRLGRLLVTPGDPTTEMLAACLMTKLNAFLAADGTVLRCVELTVEETPTNAVTLTGDPAEVLPAHDRGGWWSRADDSINDLAP